MVLVGHSQRQAQPLTRRQRRGMQATAAIIVVLGIVVWFATKGTPFSVSRHGCVSVVLAGATGGNIERECGADARSWCKAEYARKDLTAVTIQKQCRIAGIEPRSTTRS
jgi:hypothetical protein